MHPSSAVAETPVPTATDRLANIEESLSRLENMLNVLVGKLEPVPMPGSPNANLKAVIGPGLLERAEVIHQRAMRLAEEYARSVDRL